MDNESFRQKNTKKDYEIVNEVQEQVIEFANMINILADVSIYCVKNKDKLGRFQWRTSIFFLY